MMRLIHKITKTSLLVIALMTSVSMVFAAEDRWSMDNLWSKQPVRQGAIGAAAGAAGGILSDRVSVGKGAATGAVVGVGSGLLTQSRYFNDRPLLRNALQGAAIGTGTSYATGSNKIKGAAVGAGAGAGYHYIRKYMDDRR